MDEQGGTAEEAVQGVEFPRKQKVGPQKNDPASALRPGSGSEDVCSGAEVSAVESHWGSLAPGRCRFS